MANCILHDPLRGEHHYHRQLIEPGSAKIDEQVDGGVEDGVGGSDDGSGVDGNQSGNKKRKLKRSRTRSSETLDPSLPAYLGYHPGLTLA